MNCNDFEKIVNDLACDRLMEAGKKEEAWAHTKVCMRCVARLVKEKFLTASLRLAAKEDTASASAPAHVKANLLAAFAQQSNSSVVAFAPVHKAKSSNYFWKYAAIAAAIVIAFVAIAAMRSLFTRTDGFQQAANANVEIKGTPKEVIAVTPNQEEQEASPRTPQKNEVNRVVRRNNVAKTQRPKAVTPSIENETSKETTTDFIALTYTGGNSASSNGMIVRVKVPRATLIAMGLPLNAAQTEGYVKADLVVGEDGVARAIRLVQDSSTSETKE